MPRIPLPPQLAKAPFAVGHALELGVGRGRLRGPDLLRPFHGVRSSTATHAALAYAPRLRSGDRFSHLSAAAIWPVPLPNLRHPVHVTTALPGNRVRSAGVIGHRSAPGLATIRHGLPVSDPVALLVELATLLTEEDLVAVGDSLVLSPEVLDPYDVRPWISVRELRDGCAASRSPGARRARRAAEQVRQGAESRAETRLRLLILSAGLPEPELQGKVFDARGFVGRFDMVYREARVIVEYDGDQHRTSTRQYEWDMTRIDRALADNWKVVRVRSAGLSHRRALTVARVRDALTR